MLKRYIVYAVYLCISWTPTFFSPWNAPQTQLHPWVHLQITNESSWLLMCDKKNTLFMFLLVLFKAYKTFVNVLADSFLDFMYFIWTMFFVNKIASVEVKVINLSIVVVGLRGLHLSAFPHQDLMKTGSLLGPLLCHSNTLNRIMFPLSITVETCGPQWWNTYVWQYLW